MVVTEAWHLGGIVPPFKKKDNNKNYRADLSVCLMTIEKMGPPDSSLGFKYAFTNLHLCIFKSDRSDLRLRLGRISRGLIWGD